jgi:IS5 family transposase
MKPTELGLDLISRNTRNGKLLSERNRVVRWGKLLAPFEPHTSRLGRGCPPVSAEVTLRIHFLQQLFGLSDMAVEVARFAVPLYRQFAGLGSFARLPDFVSILRFRHLLEQHEFAPKVLEAVNAPLTAKGLMLEEGTADDASLIAAPSSAKNGAGARDPEMHQTRKAYQWCFEMGCHMGIDADTSPVHEVVGTAADVADVTQAQSLLHGYEGTSSPTQTVRATTSAKRTSALRSTGMWPCALVSAMRWLCMAGRKSWSAWSKSKPASGRRSSTASKLCRICFSIAKRATVVRHRILHS